MRFSPVAVVAQELKGFRIIKETPFITFFGFGTSYRVTLVVYYVFSIS